MKAYRAKTKNTTPCHGVVGGVVEIPPETRVQRTETIRYTLTRRVVKYNSTNTMVVAHTHTCYDNANVTAIGLVRALLAFAGIILVLFLFY